MEPIRMLYLSGKELEELGAMDMQLALEDVEEALKLDVQYDFAHFWEDICFKNSGVHALAGAGKNVTIRRCHFENNINRSS